jgi:hypothetical protein
MQTRTLGYPCLAALLILLALTAPATAQAPLHSASALLTPHPGTISRTSPHPLPGRAQRASIFNVQASHNGPQPANETAIATNPLNNQNWVSSANDYNCTASLIGAYATTNAGRSWTGTCLPALPGLQGCGQSSATFDLNGTAYLAGIDWTSCFNGYGPSAVELATSTNNGVTWSAPHAAITSYYPGGLVANDDIAVDATSSSPFANRIYISTTQYDSTFTDSTIQVGYSTDGGMTFHTANITTATFPTIDQFSDLAVAASGTVYVAWFTCTAGGTSMSCAGSAGKNEFFSIARSTDGGITWSQPVKIATTTPFPSACSQFFGTLPNTCVRVSNRPLLAVDNSNGKFAGRLYCVYQNWNGTSGDILVKISTDGGITWNGPVKIDSGTNGHDTFMPAIAVSPNGTVAVTWLDRRNDPANKDYENFGAGSTNSGATWTTNTQISTAESNPCIGPFFCSFIGDYIGAAWVGTAGLITAYCDTRTGQQVDEIGIVSLHPLPQNTSALPERD